MTTRSTIVQRLPNVLAVRKAEAAAMMGISASYFDKLIAEGDAPKGRRLGDITIWPVDDLRAYINSLPEDGLPEAGEIDL